MSDPSCVKCPPEVGRRSGAHVKMFTEPTGQAMKTVCQRIKGAGPTKSRVVH